jgi:hypothetical protein
VQLNQCSYLDERLLISSNGKVNGHSDSRRSLSSIIHSSFLEALRMCCRGAKSVIGYSVKGISLCDISATGERKADLSSTQEV